LPSSVRLRNSAEPKGQKIGRGAGATLPWGLGVAGGQDRPGEHWKVANHIVVALDIVQDEARGREIVEK
jgi:hypothetical protein